MKIYRATSLTLNEDDFKTQKEILKLEPKDRKIDWFRLGMKVRLEQLQYAKEKGK